MGTWEAMQVSATDPFYRELSGGLHDAGILLGTHGAIRTVLKSLLQRDGLTCLASWCLSAPGFRLRLLRGQRAYRRRGQL